MAGEIPHEDQHPARRPGRGKQHITIENGQGRSVITNIGGIQAAGMSHVIEDPFGDFLLFGKLSVALTNEIPLIREGPVHQSHSVESLDLGFNDDPVIGLSQEVIATGLQASGQGTGFREGGQENQGNQPFTSQEFDLTGRFHAIHDRHQGVQQHQIRRLPLENRDRVQPVCHIKDFVPQSLQQCFEDQAIAV